MASRASTVRCDDDALFVEDGVPVKFCFHRSVTQGRGQITRDVERHGGKIVADEQRANVLLVDEQQDIAFLRRRYYSSTELYRLSLYVEPRGFVQHCIRAGEYFHVPPRKQGMPGRAPGGGRVRVPFTEEDRDHLAYYIATRCPTRDGRMGNNAYRDLEQLGRTDDPSWEWARRHTFHSWREHYKMNAAIMDARIEYYLERLKDIGHHFGHDPRRHDHRVLRQEEEEGSESESDEEEEQWEGIERQGNERREREQVRPGGAARQARDYLVRHEEELETFDEEDDSIREDEEEEEMAIRELEHIKRQRAHAQRQRDAQEMQVKRPRISDASNDEAGRGESTPSYDESQEFEDSDLFGDCDYGDESPFELDDQEIEFPMPSSPRMSLVAELEGAPLSTQATLVASPRKGEMEKGSMSGPAQGPPQTKVVEGQAPAPYQNTRALSRSVEPQPQPQPGSGHNSQQQRREDQKGRGKKKAREEVPVVTEEDGHVEEAMEGLHEEEVDTKPAVVTGGLSTLETLEDEMVVEGLLEASVVSGVGEEDEGSEQDKDDEESVGVYDEDDEDIRLGLPQFQEIDIKSEPSDSDDAETHGTLVRGGAREGTVGADEDQEREQNEDGDEEDADADADRIERMARGSLYAVPAPTPPESRVTRSMAAAAVVQTEIQIQTGTQTKIGPRRTRSDARALPPGFPSPGTKARAVVDRFQEGERQTPYEPPAGSRAARAVRGKERQG